MTLCRCESCVQTPVDAQTLSNLWSQRDRGFVDEQNVGPCVQRLTRFHPSLLTHQLLTKIASVVSLIDFSFYTLSCNDSNGGRDGSHSSLGIRGNGRSGGVEGVRVVGAAPRRGPAGVADDDLNSAVGAGTVMNTPTQKRRMLKASMKKLRWLLRRSFQLSWYHMRV